MYVDINNSYRFIRSADQHEQMVRLRDNLKIFRDYSTIMMASAIIGFKNGLYKEIVNRASDRVQLTFFNNTDLEIIDLIAYAHTKEQKVLKSEEKYHIFENYAYGGFPVLYEKLGITDETGIDKREEILTNYYSLIKNPKGFNL